MGVLRTFGFTKDSLSSFSMFKPILANQTSFERKAFNSDQTIEYLNKLAEEDSTEFDRVIKRIKELTKEKADLSISSAPSPITSLSSFDEQISLSYTQVEDSIAKQFIPLFPKLEKDDLMVIGKSGERIYTVYGNNIKFEFSMKDDYDKFTKQFSGLENIVSFRGKETCFRYQL